MIVKLFVVDINQINMDDLLSSPFINKQEKKELANKYANKDVYNEKIISLYLKNKYIGKYSLNEYGKPISTNCFFNISHSHGLVVLAVNSKCDIGVDVEKKKIVEDKYKIFICNDEEYKFIQNDIDFLKIWTNKESLLKCVGIGITKKLNEVKGLPIDGVRTYENKEYRSKIILYDEYIISVTIANKDEFEIEIIK